jgi:hypothetical protein
MFKNLFNKIMIAIKNLFSESDDQPLLIRKIILPNGQILTGKEAVEASLLPRKNTCKRKRRK